MPRKDEAFFLSFTSALETKFQIYRTNNDLVNLNCQCIDIQLYLNSLWNFSALCISIRDLFRPDELLMHTHRY